jgi:hypothetical protein
LRRHRASRTRPSATAARSRHDASMRCWGVVIRPTCANTVMPICVDLPQACPVKDSPCSRPRRVMATALRRAPARGRHDDVRAPRQLRGLRRLVHSPDHAARAQPRQALERGRGARDLLRQLPRRGQHQRRRRGRAALRAVAEAGQPGCKGQEVRERLAGPRRRLRSRLSLRCLGRFVALVALFLVLAGMLPPGVRGRVIGSHKVVPPGVQ